MVFVMFGWGGRYAIGLCVWRLWCFAWGGGPAITHAAPGI